MHACRQCGGAIGDAYRYCPWCAVPQRAKLVESFGGTGAEAGKALRVSHYVTEGHVRFSVWDESGVAEAAVSVDEEQARRVASFLSAGGTAREGRAANPAPHGSSRSLRS